MHQEPRKKFAQNDQAEQARTSQVRTDQVLNVFLGTTKVGELTLEVSPPPGLPRQMP